MIPHWDWGWWVVGSAVVIFAIIVDGSYRLLERANKKIDALSQAAKPAIALSFDEQHPFILHAFTDGRPTRCEARVVIENVGGVALTNCQVQIFHDAGTNRETLAYARIKCCPPFFMKVDEITTVPILYMRDHQDNLRISNYDYVGANLWTESETTPLLLPGKTYKITIEVLSVEARKSTLPLIVTHDGDRWVIKNAPTSAPISKYPPA